VARKNGAPAIKDLERVAADTTVQGSGRSRIRPMPGSLTGRSKSSPTWPTARVFALRQSYRRVASGAIMVGRYTHAHSSSAPDAS
jgi:hypothetical protein